MDNNDQIARELSDHVRECTELHQQVNTELSNLKADVAVLDTKLDNIADHIRDFKDFRTTSIGWVIGLGGSIIALLLALVGWGVDKWLIK